MTSGWDRSAKPTTSLRAPYRTLDTIDNMYILLRVLPLLSIYLQTSSPSSLFYAARNFWRTLAKVWMASRACS